MKKDAIKEKLIYYNSLKTNIWASLIVLSGGLSSLILNLDCSIKKMLFSLGIFFEIGLFLGLLACIFKIRHYTNKLNEE